MNARNEMKTLLELEEQTIAIRMDNCEEMIFPGCMRLEIEFLAAIDIFVTVGCPSDWDDVAKLDHETRFQFNVMMENIQIMETDLGIFNHDTANGSF